MYQGGAFRRLSWVIVRAMLTHPQFDPIALHLGPLKVHWYGLTYLVAFGLFYLLASRR
ncbi:MAG: hypothetical protein RI907_1097, partial [Pseudomonadota bacterium]